MLDWVIVGGGVHGIVITTALLKRAGCDNHRMRIVDPHTSLLSAWNRRAHASGMRHLRSPGAHGLEPDFGSLRSFARHFSFNWQSEVTGRYARPSLQMFSEYSSFVVRKHDLGTQHLRARVVGLERSNDGTAWIVHLSTRSALTTRRVVLATGPGAPNVPEWAQGIGPVRHIYDERFSREWLARAAHPLIVGGGVAAIGLALRLAGENGPAPVGLFTRRSPVGSQFDSDPCFIGRRCLTGFLAEHDPEKRRDMLREARRPGTVPPDLMQNLAAAICGGKIRHRIAEIEAAELRGSVVTLTTDTADEVSGDAVALATGFAPTPAGLGLLESVRTGLEAAGMRLPVDSTGIPIVGEDLSWVPGLHLAGRLAEHELGPSAPNIIGAHNAAKRLVSAQSGQLRRVPVSWDSYGNGGWN